MSRGHRTGGKACSRRARTCGAKPAGVGAHRDGGRTGGNRRVRILDPIVIFVHHGD